MGRDDFKIRLQPQDVAGQKNPNHKNSAKVFIHPTSFAQGGFTTAFLCNVETDGASRWEAVAWPAPDKNVANNIVSVSRVLQKMAGLELGQIARVAPGGPVPDAGVVIMQEITPDPVPLPPSEQTRWQYHLESRLGELQSHLLHFTLLFHKPIYYYKRQLPLTIINHIFMDTYMYIHRGVHKGNIWILP